MPWSVTQPKLDASALTAARVQLREHSGAFDDELLAKMAAAVEEVQGITNRQLMQAAAVYTLDAFPPAGCELLLPPAPLLSVTSITYLDEDDATQTWNASLYEVHTNTEPGFVRPVPDESYPIGSGVVVNYLAGYGVTWSTVPPSVSDVVLMRLDTMFRGTMWGPNNELYDSRLASVMVGDELRAYL